MYSHAVQPVWQHSRAVQPSSTSVLINQAVQPGSTDWFIKVVSFDGAKQLQHIALYMYGSGVSPGLLLCGSGGGFWVGGRMHRFWALPVSCCAFQAQGLYYSWLVGTVLLLMVLAIWCSCEAWAGLRQEAGVV